MAKVIIGIHGLGNKPPKELLEKWWKKAILEGFNKLALPVPEFKFELVYWADLVYRYPENPEITDKKDPYFLEEPYTPSPAEEATKITNHSWRKKILQFIEKELEKVFLNEDLSLNYADVSDAIMYKYFMELEMYYGASNEQITLKQKTRNRLLQLIEKHKFDDLMILSHSMGTIIAYDVLQFELKNKSIHTFVTMGSPLGLPFIRAKIAKEIKTTGIQLKIATPECVTKSWINFADLEDKIALNFDLNNDFTSNSKGIQVADYEIKNDYSVNGIKNPHKIYGYLRSKEFIEQLQLFLSEKKELSIRNIVKDIRKIGHQIKYSTRLKQRI
ncbi:MAG: hypothetical protein JW857_00480 [Bacteroidales bacterium]|nr:hypothetical protein [Bacteroidales bacterium]